MSTVPVAELVCWIDLAICFLYRWYELNTCLAAIVRCTLLPHKSLTGSSRMCVCDVSASALYKGAWKKSSRHIVSSEILFELHALYRNSDSKAYQSVYVCMAYSSLPALLVVVLFHVSALQLSLGALRSQDYRPRQAAIAARQRFVQHVVLLLQLLPSCRQSPSAL